LVLIDFLKMYREKKISRPGIKGFQLNLLDSKPKKEGK
jgi:hypothetical protein